MNVLAMVHLYPPTHNAGAEWYAHAVLRELQRRGHKVRVGIRSDETYTFQRIGVIGTPAAEDYRWADVIITHLDMTRKAVEMARVHHRPLVHIVHNDRQLGFHRVRPPSAQLVIFNSAWIARKLGWRGRFIVVPPPVIAADYRCKPGKAITLVNLTEAKGAGTFFDLARRMPDREFLAVKGSYGIQVTPGDVGNVTFLDNTRDIRTVYRKTRLLLMPSLYESWGRVGIEAAISGIPTIAHPTPGLVESLSWAGTFVDREDTDAWARAIEYMDEPSAYAERSGAALERASGMDPMAGLDLIESELLALVP